MQSLKSCGKLSQLGSSSPPRDHTSLNLNNDKLKNPFAYLALPIGSHLVAWNLGVFLFCNILPVGYSAVFDSFLLYSLGILQHLISASFLLFIHSIFYSSMLSHWSTQLYLTLFVGFSSVVGTWEASLIRSLTFPIGFAFLYLTM